MRTKGKPEELERIRMRAVKAVADGVSQKEVAKVLGVDPTTVCKWFGKFLEDPELLRAKPIRGRPPRLKAGDLARLAELIRKGPCAFGWENDLWSCSRVTEILTNPECPRSLASGFWHHKGLAGFTPRVWSQSYQITAFWQHAFDHSWSMAARPTPSAPEITTATTALEGSVTSPQLEATNVFTRFNLGTSFKDAVIALETLTSAPVRQWGELVYADYKVFTDIPQRQRLVLEPGDEKVKRAALLIDVDSSIPGQIGDVLDRVRRTLIEQLGAPTEVDERGTFGPHLAERHRAGLFTRTTQWQLPGGIVRLGLPRRLDGRLRVEVHYAAMMGRLRDPSWGLDLMD